MTVNGYGVSFGGDTNVLKSIVMMTAKLSTYTKNH